MDSLQRKLEQLFCPPLDSTLIAAIVNDYQDFDICYDILNSLAKEANSVLDAEKEEFIENELSSGKSSSNYRSSSEPSSGETGDDSSTSLECSMDGLSVRDELDFASTCSATDYEERSQLYDSEQSAEFLKTIFPMLSEVRIDTLLRENDYNTEMVLDVILNEVYLEIEQQEEYLHSTSPPISVRDSNYDEDNPLVSESKHRKKKRRRKPKQNIIFQNSGHRPNSNKSSSQNSPVTLGPPIPSSSSSSSSALSFSSSSPSSSSHSSSISPSCWNTPWASSSSIQSKNPWNNIDYESQESSDEKLSQLLNIFPDHDIATLKRALFTCKGEVNNATEMLLRPDIDRKSSTATSYSPFLPNGVVYNLETGEYQINHHHNKKRNDSIQVKNHNRTTLSSRTPSISLNSNKFKNYDDDEDGYDPVYCRKKAFEYFNKRNEAFKKAREAHRKKEGGIASHYSTEGGRFDDEMKAWNLRAARSSVKKKCEKIKDDHVLDLHGCSVKESLIIVEEWLDDWYSQSVTLKPLKIITGNGNHSLNGVAKLPNAINKFLTENNWNITKHRGYVLVNGLKNTP